MSTRSHIGILDIKTGVVDYIYCHFDGYETGVGACLQEHYLDANKVQRLINGGDISYLGNDLASEGFIEFIEEAKKEFDKFTEFLYLNFSKLDVTLSYNLWRNEEIHVGKKTLEEYSTGERDMGIEYMYLYANGIWWVRKYDSEMVVLKDRLKNITPE